MPEITDRKIVIVNQAANYLTIGFCNAFKQRFSDVTLITGSIHTQGEELHADIDVHYINKWYERPASKKLISYLIGCIRIYLLLITKYRKHEVFFVSVPPMAYLLNLGLSNRFSMVIWDVFPDALKITSMKESHLLYRLWAWLNIKSFYKAYKIFTIGDRMADLVEQYVDRDKIIIQPIWSIFQENERISKENNLFVKEQQIEGKFIVQYSGNIGLTHKVELFVELAEKLKYESQIQFQIIGRGPRVPHLKQLVEDKNLPKCQFLPFQSDEMFPYSLSVADLGVVILDELTAKGSVPSKSYNLMNFGIPSLYIASEDSELNDYAKRFRHAECYTEQQLGQAAAFIKELCRDTERWEKYSRNAEIASTHFRRDNADKFVQKYIGPEAS